MSLPRTLCSRRSLRKTGLTTDYYDAVLDGRTLRVLIFDHSQILRSYLFRGLSSEIDVQSINCRRGDGERVLGAPTLLAKARDSPRHQ